MSTRLLLILVAVSGVLGNGFFAAVGLGLRWRATDRRWVRTGPLRRLYRGPRALLLRYLFWYASWPHLVDRLLRTGDPPAFATPNVVVWRRGRATIQRFGDPTRARSSGDAVLVVHSVVTRPWILDLVRERSVIGALVETGEDVYLLDWGDPALGDSGQGIAGHTTVLAEAVAAVAQRSATGKVHVVGYCMGATLALAAVGAWGPGPIRSLVLVAPPYDTEVPGGTATALRLPALMPVLALDGDGCVPGAYIREAFHLLRRDELKAAWARLRRRKDKDFQRVAAAMARWAWEQRRVPGALWFDLVDLFRDNAMLNGTLRIGDDEVRLDRVTVPTLIVVTDRDHIVPIASSLALTRVIPHAEVVRSPAGHVSMLMGHESRVVTVPAIARWLREGTLAPKPVPPPPAAKVPRRATARRTATARRPGRR